MDTNQAFEAEVNGGSIAYPGTPIAFVAPPVLTILYLVNQFGYCDTTTS